SDRAGVAKRERATTTIGATHRRRRRGQWLIDPALLATRSPSPTITVDEARGAGKPGRRLSSGGRRNARDREDVGVDAEQGGLALHGPGRGEDLAPPCGVCPPS